MVGPRSHAKADMMLSSSLFLSLALFTPTLAQEGEPPVRAPFEKFDTLCVNDWWERDPSKIIDLRVPRDQVVAFGMYTVHAGILKLTAQLYPLYPKETRTVRLELRGGRCLEGSGELRRERPRVVDAVSHRGLVRVARRRVPTASRRRREL